MLNWSTEDFNEIKSLVTKLPANGDKVINVLFLNKILNEIKETNSRLDGFDKKEYLSTFKNETLKTMLEDKEIDHKDCKNKEQLIKKLLGD